MPDGNKVRFCGHDVTAEELQLIAETVTDFPNLSRTELAHTVCELLDWRRPTGALKAHECRFFLEELDVCGILRLPDRQGSGSRAVRKIRPGQRDESEGQPEPLVGNVKDFGPVRLEMVESTTDQRQWREWVGHHHYLGFTVPFGAQLRYFVGISQPERIRVGCVQLSSPAWRMAARDRWIGWDEAQKTRRLQLIVQNSRFLILPWVQIKNLASSTLALVARQFPQDWQVRYNVRPVLLETLVDPAHYRGTCYIAANWIHLGITTGRGRQDRSHKRFGDAPKEVFVYPLNRHWQKHLLDPSELQPFKPVDPWDLE
jgi:hypothetical protein